MKAIGKQQTACQLRCRVNEREVNTILSGNFHFIIIIVSSCLWNNDDDDSQ
jgi:hypothetical protein